MDEEDEEMSRVEVKTGDGLPLTMFGLEFFELLLLFPFLLGLGLGLGLDSGGGEITSCVIVTPQH